MARGQAKNPNHNNCQFAALLSQSGITFYHSCLVQLHLSYLICMFQDSVPAGSYNDPFLSSVCVHASVCKDLCVQRRLFVKARLCKDFVA